MAKRFQRRGLKCEKLKDDRWWMPSDGKSSHCHYQSDLKTLNYPTTFSKFFFPIESYRYFWKITWISWSYIWYEIWLKLLRKSCNVNWIGRRLSPELRGAYANGNVSCWNRKMNVLTGIPLVANKIIGYLSLWWEIEINRLLTN